MWRVICLSFAIWLLSLNPVGAQNWRDSLAAINAEIARSPYSAELHLRKAAVNIELGQWDYAVNEYGIVLDHNPDNPAALYYRAFAHTQQRHYEIALADYEHLLRIVPQNMEGRLGHAYVQQRLGRMSEALDELNLMVEMFPGEAIVFATRAALEREMNQPEASLYDWQHAMELEPLNADYVVSCVDLLLSQERMAEARYELEEAVKRGVPRGSLRQWFAKCRKVDTSNH